MKSTVLTGAYVSWYELNIRTIVMGEAFLEDYTLIDELGQGGFATVYKVRHNRLGYTRAIRVLNATIAKGESDTSYQKFLEECRLLLRLGNGCHPNIVHIFQPLLRAQKALVEMDYVNGVDLAHFLEENVGFVETGEVIKLVEEIGSALAYCHEDIYRYCMDREEDDLEDDPEDGSKVLMTDEIKSRLINKYRVIHNDIHSGNIMRNCEGRFVLLDFGLSIEGDSVVRSSRRHNGAPEFKAPEKWDGDTNLSTQSDIYSFGIVLYEMLAGRVPFQFDKKRSNAVEAEYLLSKAHKEDKPEPIFALRKQAFENRYPGQVYQKDYPDWLEALIMRCLEKKPENRFATAKELYNSAKESMANSNRADYLEAANGNLSAEVEKLNAKLQDAERRIEELSSRGAIIVPDVPRGNLGHDSGTRINILKKENNLLNNEIKKLAKRNLTTVVVSAVLLLATLAACIFI